MKKILFVDDDQQMQNLFQQGVKRFNISFEALTANDGVHAIEILNREFISVVVTDLKMPRMDGYTLLKTIVRDYPDIPVIVVTAYGTLKIKNMVLKTGAIALLDKPFKIERLIGTINALLKREAEGGTLLHITPGMFLQLVEMEEKTCTIRLLNHKTNESGVLFFDHGFLYYARTASLLGEEAAYEILAWDDVSLSIQNVCLQKEDRIKSDLQGILLEAMHRKDEKEAAKDEDDVLWLDADANEEEEPKAKLSSKPVGMPLKAVREKLKKKIGAGCLPDDMTTNSSWDAFLFEMAKFAECVNGGKLKVGFVDNGSLHQYIVLPGPETLVLSLNPMRVRDTIMDLFSH